MNLGKPRHLDAERFTWTDELRQNLIVPAIKVQDSTSSGEVIHETFGMEVPSACTLRDLIRCRVREEVARQNASPSPTYRGLVCPEGASAAEAGFALASNRRRIDWERQADIAEEAFNRNGFFVFLHDSRRGERQLDDLDGVVEVPTDAELRFIRLVHLVGG